MFTGIVEGVAEVVEREERPDGQRLRVRFPIVEGPWSLGQSVAVDGVCLTVAAIEEDVLAFDLAGETLRRTSLGGLFVGGVVNFERGLHLGARLDGHLVQGHVDGVGVVSAIRREGADVWFEVEASAGLLAQMLPQGSITVDGVSLTVARLGADRFACTLVPHTLAVTSLGRRKAGDRVNLETDCIGKWVARLLPTALPGGTPPAEPPSRSPPSRSTER